jgi:CRISPR system Cascade subunit CasE
MYLTRMYLNPLSRVTQRVLANPQALHAKIAEATEPTVTGVEDTGRTLWRVDLDDVSCPVLWILSAEKPRLDRFADEVAKIVDGLAFESKNYSPLLDRLASGQVYAFRLAANPVHSGRRSADSADTQRFGHVTITQQLDWLMNRARGQGFAVCTAEGQDTSVEVVNRRKLFFYRQTKRITILVTDFVGYLEVQDPLQLRLALMNGIGHARAYGCGLMTLAKAPRIDT